MPFESPTEPASPEDLKSLLWSGLDDARKLETRQELPLFTDAEAREEFLNEVASFANAMGGHILYGAAKGATEPAGLERSVVEGALNWLEQTVNSGIAPRIVGLRWQVIGLPNGKSALLVRVPKSWAGPHMVVFRQANKFYSRTSDGRCLLDIEGLRSAFAWGESCREKMRAFRLERINAILNGTLTVHLAPHAPKTVLHVLPLASFQPGFRIDLESVATEESQMTLPMEARGSLSHYNFDGLVTFSSMQKYAYSYVQVFRNGCLEAAETLLLEPQDGRKVFPGAAFEREIICCGERLLQLLRRLQVAPPYVVMLSFLGVRGYGMFAGAMRWRTNTHPIERDHLFLDEVILGDTTTDFSRAIRPAFDQVWNACGWPKSLHYDSDGNWREQTG